MATKRGKSRWVAPPPPMEAALRILLGDEVGRVRVREHAWTAALHRAIAVTRVDTVYLAIPGDLFFADPVLVLHEYYHVVRQWNTGDLTVARYLREHLRSGYRGNRYEVEARRFAEEQAARFERLLKAGEEGG